MATYKKKECYKNASENPVALKCLEEKFGHALHIDIIKSVARSQQWNLKMTCSILDEMTSNVAPIARNTNKKKPKPEINSVAYSNAEDNDADVLVEEEKVKTGYGAVAKKKPVPQQQQPQQRNTNNAKSVREMEFEKVCAKVNSGNRVLVLMRGLPGSGKSHLARRLVGCNVSEDPRMFIFSTDDYFMTRGTYMFNPLLLQDAHVWNQRRVHAAAQMAVSPIVVDNTNTQLWEMRPYAVIAVQFGYQLCILEPDTRWHSNCAELARRNSHGVPKQKIADMLQRYDKNVTGDKLLAGFGLQYLPNLRPPQARLYPPVRHPPLILSPPPQITPQISQPQPQRPRRVKRPEPKAQDLLTTDSNMEYVLVNSDNSFVYQKQHIEAEESDLIVFGDGASTNKPTEKVPESSEDGESPDSESNDQKNPPFANEGNTSANLIHLSDDEDKKIPDKLNEDIQSLLINPVPEVASNPLSEEILSPTSTDVFNFPKLDFGANWDSVLFHPKVSAKSTYSSELLNQMVSREAGTNTSSVDFSSLTRTEADQTVLFGSARNISDRSFPKQIKAPPKVLMLEKGTMTGVGNFLEASPAKAACNNQAQHFGTFIKMFPQIERDVLQDIFDKCQGDINWAVDLVIEGSGELLTAEPIEMEPPNCEIHPDAACNCTAEYEVHPFVQTSVEPSAPPEETPTVAPKKLKTRPTGDPHLKKHIEDQIIISDEYYSDHIRNLKKKRHGEPINSPVTHSNTPESFESESETDSEDLEESVELNVGTGVIEQLEKEFGNAGSEYPTGFQPVLRLPASLARQLHTLWLESVCEQMDSQRSVLDEMRRQDEELARQLQAQENSQEVKTHVVPPLQEIMDMEIALAVYRADQEQWRKETPDDMASRMTRQKLFETFPDLEKDVLVEILQAHENCFEKTVEALRCSVGPTDKLERDDQLEKARKEVEAEKGQEDDEKVTHSASYYREQAAHHLEMRRKLFQKAQQSIQRGMPQVATYYSDVARLHTQKYELANNRAATAFLSEHSLGRSSSDTLDLHFLYVREAEQALAVFLDSQISLLRQEGSAGKRALNIITGRGTHSAGGKPQIRPAVQRLLKERRLKNSLVNPGLVKVVIHRSSPLTNELRAT